jgi:hypothetical protein
LSTGAAGKRNKYTQAEYRKFQHLSAKA